MPPTGPCVIVLGPPGADAPAVATALAGRLELAVRDTDRDVEVRAGAEVAEIFLEQGESHFRELEREAVVEALAGHDGVLVLGGGAVMDPRTEADLQGRTVVVLEVSVTQASRRIGLNRDRPMAIGNPRAQWIRLMEGRRPVYERVATLTVGTDDADPDDVAARIEAALA